MPTRGEVWAGRARAERTQNMLPMFVTLDVSQLEMSASKLFKLWKSSLMSVMAETHQSAMGPYIAMALTAFELNSVTAVFREALVVKVEVQACVGGLGDGGGGIGDGNGGGGLGDGGGGLGLGGGGLGEGGGGDGNGGDGLGDGGGGDGGGGASSGGGGGGGDGGDEGEGGGEGGEAGGQN